METTPLPAQELETITPGLGRVREHDERHEATLRILSLLNSEGHGLAADIQPVATETWDMWETDILRPLLYAKQLKDTSALIHRWSSPVSFRDEYDYVATRDIRVETFPIKDWNDDNETYVDGFASATYAVDRFSSLSVGPTTLLEGSISNPYKDQMKLYVEPEGVEKAVAEMSPEIFRAAIKGKLERSEIIDVILRRHIQDAKYHAKDELDAAKKFHDFLVRQDFFKRAIEVC